MLENIKRKAETKRKAKPYMRKKVILGPEGKKQVVFERITLAELLAPDIDEPYIHNPEDPDFEKEMEKPYLHFPAQDGECLTCHRPHFTNHKNLLVAVDSSLCKDCHDLKDIDFINNHSRIATERSNCVSCHKPHSSENENLFRTITHSPFSEKLCQECHEK